ADFPPLKTSATWYNNVPTQTTALIGREKEVAAARQLVSREDVRLVTFTGPGGVGKTRLALQVATELSHTFVDGLYFIDLAPVSDAALVIATIAQALGLREEREMSLQERLQEELRPKHVLLLLDNFEQVIGAATYVVGLLAACPQLKILVTSRAVLRVRAEYEFVVPPLSVLDFHNLPDQPTLSQFLQNEAIVLFIQRAQTVKPDFQLTRANAPTVADIVARLDGLPLAIELAAARMKMLSPQTLLTRLGRRLHMLIGGASDVAARQRTLRNTIEWSYNLLNAQEQQLFRRLSIFTGGCTLEAVEAVYANLDNEAEAVLDMMASLIDNSLLQLKEQAVGTEPRFIMLETLREYGLECLRASEEMAATRKTLAAYLLALAQKADTEIIRSEQIFWVDRLEQEYDNVRAVMQWLLEPTEDGGELALRLGSALYSFWQLRGYFTEGRDFLEQALTRGKATSLPVQARATYVATRLNEVLGNHDRAEALCEESLALYRELGDAEGIAYALHLRADIAWGRGNLAVARSQAEEALTLFEQSGNEGAIAFVSLHLGVLAIDQGDYAKAFALLEKSLAMNRALQDNGSIAESLFNLARAHYFSQGDLALATTLLEESLTLAKELGDKETTAYCLCLSGMLALAQGNGVVAHTLVEQGVIIFREMRHRHGIAISTASLAKVHVAQGDNAAAQTLYKESITFAQKAGDKLNIAAGLEGLASTVAAQGEYGKAAQLWGAAEAMRERIDAPVPPIDRVPYKQAMATTCNHLGKQAFARAWAEGRMKTLDEILRANDV
ncbi:MAG: tetratricopeptide repeat protein, partial [Ktedonobacteraceae bacterium]